ncbi:MAG TPA: hypothetical protein VL403_18635 [Candidatus Kryptonia bacterium]|nr:hypothetical protein [Candidatus Kryptonia bacterium]
MELKPLFTVTGTAVVEPLGKVQGGERIKVEYRGATSVDSLVTGKAHGSDWIFVGPLGPGETNSVCEISTPEKEHVVVELRGYAVSHNGSGYEIRSAGMIRTSATRFTELNGRVALVVEQIRSDSTVEVTAYQF